jgi:hypothetical protein
LKRVEIILEDTNHKLDTIQNRVEYIVNQFIDHFNLPMNKFKSPMSLLDKRVYQRTFTSNSSSKFDRRFSSVIEFDNEYINFDDFESWSKANSKSSNKIPGLM